MSIEQDLHQALRRKLAPADFAERVLARLEPSEGRRHSPLMRSVRLLAAAAAVTIVATGGLRYYTYQQAVAEAERVKQDIRIALQITSEKLAFAQQRVERTAGDSPR